MQFINEAGSPGIRRGGVLNVVRHRIAVVCPAESIPERIVADLTGLDINDSLHISAVTLPEGVRPTITGRDFTIATIAAPAGVKEEMKARRRSRCRRQGCRGSCRRSRRGALARAKASAKAAAGCRAGQGPRQGGRRKKE